ncbi:hypothetical protein [Methanotorris igneus]|uniref:hypothetical protein n=1 Tax=Methanotorris igneus TaxID=2189 RepID=UPI00155AF3ED|nr:hypothetical protein [Methanotorris igneus]
MENNGYKYSKTYHPTFSNKYLLVFKKNNTSLYITYYEESNRIEFCEEYSLIRK